MRVHILTTNLSLFLLQHQRTGGTSQRPDGTVKSMYAMRYVSNICVRAINKHYLRALVAQHIVPSIGLVRSKEFTITVSHMTSKSRWMTFTPIFLKFCFLFFYFIPVIRWVKKHLQEVNKYIFTQRFFTANSVFETPKISKEVTGEESERER